MDSARTTVAPGAFCAHCIDAPATHRGRLDRGGPLFDLCDACDYEPAREGHGIERGYEPNGGLPTAKEADAGARRAMGNARYERDTEVAIRGGMAPGHKQTEEEALDTQRRFDVLRRWRTGANGRVGVRSRRERKLA